MLFITAAVVVGLAWIYLWFATQPPQAWTDCYKRGLSRPSWACDILFGDASSFVSWSGICPSVWERRVEPSIMIVKASVKMRDSLCAFFPTLCVETFTPIQKAAACVYYTHLCAGVKMTPEEAAQHTFMVYYGGDDVIKDLPAAALRLVHGADDLFADPLPAALHRHLTICKEHFRVFLQPRMPLEEQNQFRPEPTSFVKNCKME